MTAGLVAVSSYAITSTSWGSTAYAFIADDGHIALACYAFLHFSCFVWARQLMPSPLPRLLLSAAAAMWVWSLWSEHAPEVCEERFMVVWTAIIGEVFIGYSLDFHLRMQWISTLLYKRQLNEHKRHAREADERAVQAATEVATIATRVQEELAAYVFHELRNDSNATVGVLQCIAQSAEEGKAVMPPDVLEMLSTGLAHSYHAVQVITNMLDWTKIRAGKCQLSEKDFDLDELLCTCRQLVRHLVVGKDVELHAEAQPSGLWLCGSAFHLQQVLVNLLTNACKYTDRGFVRLTARILAEEQLGVHVLFAVEDTGQGVKPSDRQRIFESYEQGASAGTGLGLPLCRMLCKAMQSSLELECPAEGGSHFSFAVHLQRGTAPPMVAVGAVPAELPAGLRVLVADDAAVNRLLLCKRLSWALREPQISEAKTAEEALDVLANGSFELVVLDEIFEGSGSDGKPLQRGTEVTRQIRAMEAQRAGTVTTSSSRMIIIGCTGNAGTTQHTSIACAAGQDLVWPKPLPTKEQMQGDISDMFNARDQEGLSLG